MRKYWSCSKFADFIRGVSKPKSATLEDWNKWNVLTRSKHPFRFWIAEELLDNIRDIIFFPYDKFVDVRHYLVNRFITKTHTLSSFSLNKGQWYDLDYRIMHCLFDEFINFVEIELASCWAANKGDYPRSYDLYWRSAEYGLAYLNWAKDLTDEDMRDEDDKKNAQLTQQALHAREMLRLYDWWVNIRPNRIDPYEKLSDTASKKELDICLQIEYNYEQEDTEMLIKLIKIRKGLWT